MTEPGTMCPEAAAPMHISLHQRKQNNTTPYKSTIPFTRKK